MNACKTLLSLFTLLILSPTASAAGKYDNPDTIVVARDGTGEFRTIDEAIEVCRAFMDYHKVIYIKKGTYKDRKDAFQEEPRPDIEKHPVPSGKTARNRSLCSFR